MEQDLEGEADKPGMQLKFGGGLRKKQRLKPKALAHLGLELGGGIGEADVWGTKRHLDRGLGSLRSMRSQWATVLSELRHFICKMDS